MVVMVEMGSGLVEGGATVEVIQLREGSVVVALLSLLPLRTSPFLAMPCLEQVEKVILGLAILFLMEVVELGFP